MQFYRQKIFACAAENGSRLRRSEGDRFAECIDRIGDIRIDQFEPEDLKASGPQAIEEIFAHVGKDNLAAARKVLGYLKEQRSPKELIDAARVLIFLKGNNSHDYKFSSAVLEDYDHVSPGWRNRYLAAGMMQLRGSGDKDNRLVARAKAALQS